MSVQTRVVAFINAGHFLDHFVLLIFPTAVLTLPANFGADYGDRIAIATGSFLAFGVLSLPAGWLGDRWSRRHMMAVFFLGSGASLIAASLVDSILGLALALTALGCFAAIYHPVGTALLISVAGAHGRVLGLNGVFGNLGVAFAALVTAWIAQTYGWRPAFLLPGVACLAVGLAYLLLVPSDLSEQSAEAGRSAKPAHRLDWRFLAWIIAVTVLAGGFTFNTATIVLPKLVAEELPSLAETTAYVGLAATGIYLVGAFTQIVVGRLVDRYTLGALFFGLSLMQLAGFLGVVLIDGALALAAAAVILAAVYGQVVVTDLMVGRAVPDAWRARAFAARYVLGFAASASVVPIVAWLHQPETGLAPVYAVMSAFAAVIVAASLVYLIAGGRQASLQTG